jgi:hypothetical protein
MAYVASADVIAWIGAAYDSVSDLTAAHVADFITKADGRVNNAANEHFWPFNAVDSSATDGTDTYVTPADVEMASRHLAAYYALLQLKSKNATTQHDEMIGFHLDQGEFFLNQLRSGAALPANRYRDEGLTFGDGSQGWELSTSEAFLAATSPLDSGDPPHILADTVAISANSTRTAGPTAAELADMRLGTEYTVAFVDGYRRWVFRALDSRLYSDDVTSLKVSYQWDYRKDFAKPRRFTGRLLCGA